MHPLDDKKQKQVMYWEIVGKFQSCIDILHRQDKENLVLKYCA